MTVEGLKKILTVLLLFVFWNYNTNIFDATYNIKEKLIFL